MTSSQSLSGLSTLLLFVIIFTKISNFADEHIEVQRGLKELAQDFRANLRFVQSHLTPKPVSFVIIKRSPQQFNIFSQQNLLKLETEDFLGKKEKSKS